MRQTFNASTRRIGALFLAFVLTIAGAAIAAPDLIAPRGGRVVRPARPGEQAVKKIDPNTKELPFAGLAAKSSEEQAKELDGKSSEELMRAADALLNENMVADSRVVYKSLLVPKTDEDAFITALRKYAETTQRLENNETGYAELEQTLEGALEARPDSWQVKKQVAELYGYLPDTGYMLDGQFVYTHDWREDLLSCHDRKRVRKLQIYADALAIVQAEIQKKRDEGAKSFSEYRAFYISFADCFENGAYNYWRQQKLTDLSTLADYVPNDYAYRENRNSGAPVDAEGNPIFFTAPESFEAAKNDGERRQFLFSELLEIDPASKQYVLNVRSQEAQQVFGVQTLAAYRFFFNEDSGADQEERQAGIWALNTLADDETIARTATGVKRFKLPPEYDYINMWYETLEERPSDANGVLMNIAQEYQNRRQLDKAAKIWSQILERKDLPKHVEENAKRALAQIVEPRVSIDGSSVVAGTDASLNVRFRNATGAEVVAKKLNVDEVLKIARTDKFWKENGRIGGLANVLNMILQDKFAPNEDENYRNRADVRNLLKAIEKVDFVGEEVARYTIDLDPDPNHYDRVAPLNLPVKEPGAYLVEIAANDGNKDVAVVWLRDVAIVKKQFEEGNRYFALDANDGEPLVEQTIEFFVVHHRWNNGKQTVRTKSFSKRTDKSGSVLFDNKEIPDDESTQVLAIVPKDGKKNAAQYSFMDFQGLWRIFAGDDVFRNTRAFFVSDRPIYRPKQKAEFKFIVGDAQYDAPDDNRWAGQTVDYQITAPNGDKVAEKRVTLDEYGAFADSFEIPGDAQLGVYNVQLYKKNDSNGNIEYWLGDGSFRLEEYRKPEFQVTVDAPKDPVALGDSFKAKVNAKYYFGAPVANAIVSYKVTRTNYRSSYYPARYWDWFYGCGYWQFTYDCEWYPGWFRWGCCKLPPFYAPRSAGVPEVVVEGEAKLEADGTFEIEVDSSLAKLIYPNDDQEYEISADVTDQSRRTISGKGKVYAARKPFQTYVWFDRGYFRVGDTMNLGFQARRLDGKPVSGNAVVKLYQVAYEKTDDKSVKPIETEVFTQELKTNDEGKGTVEIVAANPGQYRVSCVVTSENGVAEEGGQLVIVRGQTTATAKNADYRFNSLEIIPDKPEYSVGDVAHIQLASNNPDAYVLFNARPKGDVVVGAPTFIKLDKGVAYVDVPIEVADQPNIFVQATTVFDGKLFAEQKELAVPPEKRVLDVAVEPNAERVKPGQKAAIKLRLTDVDGKPVVGQTVVTVYDKSLEYVSGGSNVGDVREFFWKWRRNASLGSMDNLSQSTFFNVLHYVYPDEAQRRLSPIGVFGNEIEFSGNMNGLAYGAMGGMGGGKAMRKGAAMRSRAAAFEDDMVVEEAEAMEFDAAAEAPMAAMAMADGAMPAPAAAPMMAKAMLTNGFDEAKMEKQADKDAGDGEDAPLVEATVRKNLADVAYWAADLKPDDDGVIEIEVDMPENLTTWKIAAWSVGAGLRVGSGESEIVTSKDVIIRMQKPRFLTQKDEVVFSANVHNYLDSEKKVRVSLEFPTDDPEKSTATLTFLDGVEQTRDVVVPAGGETRVDWTVSADGPGVATLLMKALTNEESDAIQDTIVVNEHGISKQIAVSGVVSPAEPSETKSDEPNVRESTFTLTIPAERREETTKLTVRFSPTLAGAIFDALPYLCEYPYGCTEQTLNKFLPLVMTQRALQDAGVDLAALQTKKANLNAQDLGDAQERAKQWQKRNPLNEPVFDIDVVRKRTEEGVAKLQSMQNGDGGWGWFYGPGERSTARLTALVARGLQKALECDQQVDQNAIERGKQWLMNYEREQALKIIRGKVWDDEKKREQGAWDKWKREADSTDAAVYFALAELGVHPSGFSEEYVDYEKAELNASDPFAVHAVMKELIWEARTDVQLYPLSTYAIALTEEPNLSDDGKLRVETILRLLSQYRKVDDENQTVWLDLGRVNGWYFWSWYCGEYETQAYYLRLLQRVDKATLQKLGIEDDASRLVKYLLNNRKNATYWNSTRDTALCVEAFTEYLQKTNELAPNETVKVFVDGELKTTVEYTPDNLFETDGTLELPAEALTAGEHTVTMRVEGDGPLYYNAYLEFFTLEDPIEKAGLELKTERRYYKLVERKDATETVEGGRGQAVTQRVERYDRVPLKSGDAVTSGDLIEVELIVESKNEYESILLEDLKPAGYEPVEQRSGYDGNALGAYVEYRDDRVCFFATRVRQGTSTVSYKLRAETPGKFSALPTKIWAMYAPELKGNADEFKAQVDDRNDL